MNTPNTLALMTTNATGRTRHRPHITLAYSVHSMSFLRSCARGRSLGSKSSMSSTSLSSSSKLSRSQQTTDGEAATTLLQLKIAKPHAGAHNSRQRTHIQVPTLPASYRSNAWKRDCTKPHVSCDAHPKMALSCCCRSKARLPANVIIVLGTARVHVCVCDDINK